MKTIYSAGPVQSFIVDDVKAPLIEGLNALFEEQKSLKQIRALLRAYKAMSELPVPTKENTHHPNTKVLISLRDEFFSLEDNPGRHKAFKAIWNFLIILYDYDAYYRQRIDWALEQWKTKPWQPREPNRPRRSCWREFDRE